MFRIRNLATLFVFSGLLALTVGCGPAPSTAKDDKMKKDDNMMKGDGMKDDKMKKDENMMKGEGMKDDKMKKGDK